MNSEPVISAEIDWVPVAFNGATINGIFVKNVRYDQDKKRPIRVLIKIDPGASYPPHHLPGGDEIFIVEGEVQYGKRLLRKGDYFLAPPDPDLVISSEKGGIMFYILSK